MVASRNSSPAASARRKPTLVVSPSTAVSSSASTSAAAGGLPVGAVHDHLAEHRVVRRGDDLPALQGGVDADRSSSGSSVGAAGQRTRGGAGLRQEAVEGVLGVDPRLDRVPVRG